ncbi:MAG: hypothetical protein ACI9N1_001165 [Flavobacteriales bacterium]
MNNLNYLLSSASLLLSFLAFGQQESLNILFEFDKKNIDKSSQDKINDFLTFNFEKCDNISIEIIGHTDSIGSVSYNYQLGLDRANEISSYIKSNFTKIKIKTSVSKSENIPVHKLSHFKENRRVEIKSICDNIQSISEKEVTKSPTEINKSFENDTLITFENGTAMLINANTFYPNKIKDVDFKMTEVFTKTSMIINGMPTMTADGRCLESGGMIFSGASVNGSDVTPSDSITFRIPADQIDTTMQLWDVKVVNGDTMWVESELKLNFNAKGGYYEFKANRMPSINVDVPGAGIVSAGMDKLFDKLKEDDLVVKNRWYSMEKSYLVSDEKLIVLKGDLFHTKKTKYKPCEENERDILICLAERKGKLYMVVEPLGNFRYKKFWRRYIVKRKQYIEIEDISEYEDKIKSIFGDE